MLINEFIKRRSALGSQADFAGFMGMNKNTVLRWENGKISLPKYAVIALKYVEKFGVKCPKCGKEGYLKKKRKCLPQVERIT